MNVWNLRTEWIKRVPRLELRSSAFGDHLLVYEPGDATHYEASITPAFFANQSEQLGHPGLRYCQFSIWSGSGMGNGTMLIESSGSDGLTVEGPGFIAAKLRCTDYAARVFSILIHGCLASHDLSVAREGIAKFREGGRLGFVDPDAT